MKKKVLFLFCLLFMGIGIVMAETGFKGAFSDVSNYGGDRIKYVSGFDKKGNIEAFVGTGYDGDHGLYVYDNGTLKFKIVDNGNRGYTNVALLDDYVVVYGTYGGNFSFTSNDQIIWLDVFNMSGTKVDEITWNTPCDSTSTDPCTSTGVVGRIINAGENMFAIIQFEDMGYFENAVDVPKRSMYILYQVSASGVEEVADDDKTSFDDFLVKNNNEMPYVEAIRIDGDMKAIVGDNRLFGTENKRYLRLYRGNTLVFQTDEAIEYDDDVYIRDVAILDNHVILLVQQTDDLMYVYSYTKDGTFLSSYQTGEDTHLVAGSGNSFMYNVGNALRGRVHYRVIPDISGDGGAIFYIEGEEDLNGDPLDYVKAGDTVVVGVNTDEGRELSTITLNGENISCVADDDMIRCPFVMPEKDANVVVRITPIPYKILEGANPTYTKGKKVVIRSEGELRLFKSVTVNGKELVKDKDYTLKEGSTIVTLSESYLKTLKNGKYDLAINFTDGRASTTVLAVTGNPNTVDYIVALVGIALISLLLMLTVKRIKVRQFIN